MPLKRDVVDQGLASRKVPESAKLSGDRGPYKKDKGIGQQEDNPDDKQRAHVHE
jgi:hypothetical protein